MRALLFDFDGLILDTETPVFEAWARVYEEHGHTLPLERWIGGIGTDGSSFDPLAHLEELMGAMADRETLHRRRRRHRDEILDQLDPRPGVDRLLTAATRAGVASAIASSSPRSWVEGHLERLGLLTRFHTIVCADDVTRVKPHPELYQAALRSLAVTAERAIAFEDSPNGLAAAKAAGLTCVAVPGPMTQDLPFDGADLILESLDRLSLDELRDLL